MVNTRGTITEPSPGVYLLPGSRAVTALTAAVMAAAVASRRH
ncbi:hypothetical protein [Actinoplanes couchii]|nr:hypothetical protein [Actinoplanes couchii]MDR6318429.1 hypothetical protein [Actinoplanes couchii]